MVKDPQTAGFGLVVSLFCRNQSQTKQWHRETGVAPAKAEISPSKKCNALVVSIVFLFFDLLLLPRVFQGGRSTRKEIDG